MHFRARLLMACLMAGCSSLAACSDGSASDDGTLAPGAGETSGKDADAPPTRVLCPGCKALEPIELGGETSEFDGVDGRNPGSGTAVSPFTRARHELADPALARWLELVEGTHELPLRWREGFLDAGSSGHAEQTAVSFEVTALRAFDVQFQGSPDTVLQLDVAVQLSTADRALETSFENTLLLALANDGSPRARSVESSPIVPLEQARGALDLKLDPERELKGALSLALQVSPAGARGQLRVSVQYPAEPVRRLLTGSFPDDGCGLDESPIELGSRADGFAHSPSSSLQTVAESLRNAPRAPSADATLQTLTLELGAAEQACRSGSQTLLYAPLRLSDGAIDLRQDARIELTPDDAGGSASARLWTRRQYLPGGQLSELTGITSAAAAAYLAPRVQIVLDGPGNLGGQLLLELFDARPATPLLRWCSGDACD